MYIQETMGHAPEFEWDHNKSQLNLEKHGMAFEGVYYFEWDGALEIEDTRQDYGEDRWIAIGMIDDTLFSLAYTMRGEVIRVISLRRASRVERKRYYG